MTARILEALSCGSASCACASSLRAGHGLTHCPAHDDRDPSLNVTEGEGGRLLVKCHSGTCSQGAVIAALRERGLWNGTGPARRIVTTYPYVDANGALQYEAVRYEPKDFRVRRPDGNGGYHWNLQGVTRVLYNLPDVLAVAAMGWRIYVVEGEKDADAINALGLCATTNVGGAGKWREEYSEALRGAEIVVVADKDEPGRKHAEQVASSSKFLAGGKVQVLEMPGAHVKDVSDWLSSGGTKAELEGLAGAIRNSPTGSELLARREFNGNELVNDDENAPEIAYLTFLGLLGYIVRGWSHLLAGYPRAGKTELMLRVVREWLDAGLRVLFITEESVDLWRTRLARSKGDWSGLQVLFGLGVPPDELQTRALDGREDVVVADAVRNLLQLKDETDNSEIARKVNPWIIDARAKAKTLVMLHHDRKGGGDHGEGISGGHAFLGAFDVGMELLWTNSAQPRRRTIRAYSRVVSPGEFVYEMDDEGVMRVLGDPSAVALAGVGERVIDAVQAEWRSTKEVLLSLGDPRPSEEQVRKALVAAAKAGKIERDPPITEKGTGKVHRWREAPTSPPTKDFPLEVALINLEGDREEGSGRPPTEPPTDFRHDGSFSGNPVNAAPNLTSNGTPVVGGEVGGPANDPDPIQNPPSADSQIFSPHSMYRALLEGIADGRLDPRWTGGEASE